MPDYKDQTRNCIIVACEKDFNTRSFYFTIKVPDGLIKELSESYFDTDCAEKASVKLLEVLGQAFDELRDFANWQHPLNEEIENPTKSKEAAIFARRLVEDRKKGVVDDLFNKYMRTRRWSP